jgi:hypothetical protein
LAVVEVLLGEPTTHLEVRVVVSQHLLELAVLVLQDKVMTVVTLQILAMLALVLVAVEQML